MSITAGVAQRALQQSKLEELQKIMEASKSLGNTGAFDANAVKKMYADYAQTIREPPRPAYSREQMIAMRLQWPEGVKIPLDHLITAPINDNKIAVFFVFKGTPLVIEDGAELFPSDALISQIRMIIGKPPEPTVNDYAPLTYAAMTAPYGGGGSGRSW